MLVARASTNIDLQCCFTKQLFLVNYISQREIVLFAGHQLVIIRDNELSC